MSCSTCGQLDKNPNWHYYRKSLKRENQKFNIFLVLQALVRTTSGLFVARDLRPGSAGRPKGSSLRFPLSISSGGSLGRRRIPAGRLGRGCPGSASAGHGRPQGACLRASPSRLQPGLCLAGLAPPPWGLLFRAIITLGALQGTRRADPRRSPVRAAPTQSPRGLATPPGTAGSRLVGGDHHRIVWPGLSKPFGKV